LSFQLKGEAFGGTSEVLELVRFTPMMTCWPVLRSPLTTSVNVPSLIPKTRSIGRGFPFFSGDVDLSPKGGDAFLGGRGTDVFLALFRGEQGGHGVPGALVLSLRFAADLFGVASCLRRASSFSRASERITHT